MATLTAYKYGSNSYAGASITAYDATGAAIANFSGYTAGFTAKATLMDADGAALINETVSITNATTGAYSFALSVSDLSAIPNDSVLYYELWIRPSSGDKLVIETGTVTITPTARMT